VHQMLLLEELAQHGCHVDFLERPMSDDPHDHLLLPIRSAVAEYERTLIAERMRRGRQTQRRSGRLFPWTVAPYGYLLDPEAPRAPHRVRLDPGKAAVVGQLFAWYTDLRSLVTLHSVAKRLSDSRLPTPRGKPRWTVTSVRNILRNPAYTGTAYWGKTRSTPARRRQSALRPVGSGLSGQPAPPEEWSPIPVPAIVSQATFEAAQTRLRQNHQGARRNHTSADYLLRGLVSCGQCQLACTGRATHPGYQYYLCRGRTEPLRIAQGERCTARYIPARALDALVWQDLCQVLTEPALITQALDRARSGQWLPQTLHARRQTLQTAFAQLERQQTRLLDVYVAGIIEQPEFTRKHQELAQTAQSLTLQLRQ
jgi:site-specific DNA recombinase